jgi:hypothetical protein
LRPEHVTEPRHNGRDDGCDFTATLDVVEPMGMETMVYFTINGTEICGRVEPKSAGDAGSAMRLHANIDHMHLIDPAKEPSSGQSLHAFARPAPTASVRRADIAAAAPLLHPAS